MGNGGFQFGGSCDEYQTCFLQAEAGIWTQSLLDWNVSLMSFNSPLTGLRITDHWSLISPWQSQLDEDRRFQVQTWMPHLQTRMRTFTDMDVLHLCVFGVDLTETPWLCFHKHIPELLSQNSRQKVKKRRDLEDNQRSVSPMLLWLLSLRGFRKAREGTTLCLPVRMWVVVDPPSVFVTPELSAACSRTSNRLVWVSENLNLLNVTQLLQTLPKSPKNNQPKHPRMFPSWWHVTFLPTWASSPRRLLLRLWRSFPECKMMENVQRGERIVWCWSTDLLLCHERLCCFEGTFGNKEEQNMNLIQMKLKLEVEERVL